MRSTEGTTTLQAPALELSFAEGAGLHEENFAPAPEPEACIAKISIIKIPSFLLHPRARVSPKPALMRTKDNCRREEVMGGENQPARESLFFRCLHHVLARQERWHYKHACKAAILHPTAK